MVEYQKQFVDQAIDIWNQVVEQGMAFPQEECLDTKTGDAFFSEQSLTGLAMDEKNRVVGLYILHPNNVGRCGHICNASYAVETSLRGQGIGEALVKDCLKQAKRLGFHILQFNAVVADNKPALNLYEKLGFVRLGTIPKGFHNKKGEYQDIIPHYIEL